MSRDSTMSRELTMPRDPTIEYCGRAVRNALWSKPSRLPDTMSKRKKSLGKLMRKKLFNTMDTLEDTDTDVRTLTMPELKQKRQTSIGFLRRTCMMPGCRVPIGHPITTGDSKFNPSYVPDDITDDADNDVTIAETTITLRDELRDELHDNRKFERKKLCLKRTIGTDQLLSDTNYPIELIVTDQATLDVISPTTPKCHASRDVCDITKIEDIVPMGDNEHVTLQIDRDPTINDDRVLSGSMNVSRKPQTACKVRSVGYTPFSRIVVAIKSTVHSLTPAKNIGVSSPVVDL